MGNRIYLLLKEQYEKDGKIPSAGSLHKKITQSYSAAEWVEGIYLFDAYLDRYHARTKQI